MALQQYAKLTLLVDGLEQLEATNVSVELNPQRNPVDTFAGRRGYTEGAKFVSVSGNVAVPAIGLEYDFLTPTVTPTDHSIVIPIGDKQIKFNGVFQTASISQSVNSATELSFTVEGPMDEDTVS